MRSFNCIPPSEWSLPRQPTFWKLRLTGFILTQYIDAMVSTKQSSYNLFILFFIHSVVIYFISILLIRIFKHGVVLFSCLYIHKSCPIFCFHYYPRPNNFKHGVVLFSCLYIHKSCPIFCFHYYPRPNI